MEKILTKAEIEALLNAVFEGRIEPEKELAKAEGSAINYDLFNTEAYRGFVPNLDIVYDGYIRYNRITLSNRLRKSVEIKRQEPNPTNLMILSRPFPHRSVWPFSSLTHSKEQRCWPWTAHLLLPSLTVCLAGQAALH